MNTFCKCPNINISKLKLCIAENLICSTLKAVLFSVNISVFRFFERSANSRFSNSCVFAKYCPYKIYINAKCILFKVHKFHFPKNWHLVWVLQSRVTFRLLTITEIWKGFIWRINGNRHRIPCLHTTSAILFLQNPAFFVTTCTITPPIQLFGFDVNSY